MPGTGQARHRKPWGTGDPGLGQPRHLSQGNPPGDLIRERPFAQVAAAMPGLVCIGSRMPSLCWWG
ncbi:MAG: hypothetical protein ACRDRE_05025 [Pseudonocardiaceae bacterium]